MFSTSRSQKNGCLTQKYKSNKVIKKFVGYYGGENLQVTLQQVTLQLSICVKKILINKLTKDISGQTNADENTTFFYSSGYNRCTYIVFLWKHHY